ncbi:MAG: undecaprenyldiphospho-muramoylpentapeptide beta-N-acetylglucosaminyltransferase [Candidatus Omnitrophica bacterium CG23_combo_of_CG06-09_8_20_14_all_41_10]|uniref:UDP-N-acetylglucosamine--N-acetylmuramyl-(pentapeptide) pyrophosphoryl-undecaprenol N-acetylglucosamine transferase n=1 Tax=Candidatus Sherwoodlollariibacterium unditelluris TaxID=1974757 RepID=A0A2G9YHS2_9BACT|nr:MAG: undecaprenyldiphospho-muramoylpentapeptide beta-N-acetylglucosaminyltransferase [Candidatus Omnitrophica bacterium CG23_combo_of_CG06-09_8_20_14_all_41_10]
MRVLVVAGASGGHIYPASAFLEKLKEEKSVSDTLLVLPLRSIKTDFKSCGCKIIYISSAQVSFSLNYSNIIALFKFIKGSWESFRILLKFKPDCVVGFGSLDSIPLVILAWFFRIKTLIHEQNVLPGRANKFLAKFSDKIAISFPDSKCLLGCRDEKIVLTGNPIRQGLRKMGKEEALNFFGLDKNKFTILVMGGSQGSRHINDAFLEVIALMNDISGVQVIHIAGKDDENKVADAYKKINIRAKVFGFFSSMEYAYSASDLVICRAGATTIAELIHFKLPAILIPYPFAYAHQFKNARILEVEGAGIIIKDDEFKVDRLNKLLECFIRNPDVAAVMREHYTGVFKYDAGSELVKATMALLMAQ